MSKMKGALYEIHKLDTLASRSHWMNAIHPMAKLFVTLTFIVTVVSIHKYNLAGILLMVAYPIVVFMLADLSFFESLKKVKIVLPVVCAVGIFNPFFDREVLFAVGEISITTGMISLLTLVLKGLLCVIACYLLIATTTIEKICYALRLLHIPKIVVTQILLTFRYISVLIQEANYIIQAYSLRAPKQKGVHFKVWGSLTGQLLLRSIDRAETVYESMILRGYKGEYYYTDCKEFKGRDYVYLISWLILLVTFKFGPILIMISI